MTRARRNGESGRIRGAVARIEVATVWACPKPNRSAGRPAIGETIRRTARLSERIVVFVRACDELRCFAPSR